jgi:hypothetical protein
MGTPEDSRTRDVKDDGNFPSISRRGHDPQRHRDPCLRRAGADQSLQYGVRRKDNQRYYYGSVRPDIDFAILADLDMDKKLNLDDLISRTYKFDEINEGFRLLMSGSVARGVIKFDLMGRRDHRGRIKM